MRGWWRNLWRGALALAVVATISLLLRANAGAQEPITLISDTPRNEFPSGVAFTVSFDAPAPVSEARLRYELAPDGTGASGVAECNEAAAITCTFNLVSGRGIFVIPGAEITYRWVIEDQDGNRLETPEQLYVHEDTRFDFRTISDENVSVYFHSGTESEAADVLGASIATIAEISALEGTVIDFPVKVFLYRTANEMQPAIVPGGGRGVQILGEVVYSDTAMVSADVDTLDITRHEIAHIVTRQATAGPFGVPGWLNEGISVYSQQSPLSGHQAALDAAIRNDRVLTMPELQSSATGGVASTVGLYYGQSGAIVRYLVDTYGAAKFAELLAVFRDGATPDSAFEQVYGVDALGVENGWRESVGLEPRIASATPTPQPTGEVRGQPTTSTGEGEGAPSATSDSDDDGLPFITMGVGLLLVVAVIGAGAWTYAVVRSRL